ncbi:MAG: hypothetical protein A3K77_07260 [Euryarchaeota archaeon RBG_13_31_8]|nr:MAG: hypothetical protein A3K77_07260 [Euryarchaeota archaeon RBG_13_31_8]
MNKTVIISALGIFTLLLILPISASAQNLGAINHEITLNTQSNENIEIRESILFQSNTNLSISTLDFWIQNTANNVIIKVNGNVFSYINDETRYSINVSSLGINIGDQITTEITYTIDKNTQNFEKKLFQNTSSISITYDNKMLFSGTNYAIGSQLTIPIYKTAETPKESPYIYYMIILILVIIIIIIFLYGFRRRKPTKIKEITSATEEVLATRKSLLMSLLKDLEKQYRAKDISDDTYHKLKEQYKQETVETMKMLDDMTKSKVK